MATATTEWSGLLDAPELAHACRLAGAAGTFEPLPPTLHAGARRALEAAGVTGLYRHQRLVWDEHAEGRHVLVTTGTASGKSLAFSLPCLDDAAADPRRRTLFLYPTKALARDQARWLSGLRAPGLRVAVYDGDSDPQSRASARASANALITNPDMLHVGILPNHARWESLFGSLEQVVVDEAHVYRGVLGSHVANVLRRLRRVARIHGSEPRFLLASATIGNPDGLARMLTGLDVTVVSEDSAARPDRVVAIWNPELIDPSLGLRASALGEAARILAQLVEDGHRTICFTKSRKAAELVHRFACDRVSPELAERLSPYRAGYTPAQRRSIEQRLLDGDLLGVTSTDALELGIDVGALDCAVCVGFPGTVASLRQQWGRAGRRRTGLAVLVCSEDALDQFFARHPQALLGRPVEEALLDHRNPRILAAHVRAAAFEAPLTATDADPLGSEAIELADRLTARGELRRTPAGLAWAGRDYPAGRIGLRSTDRHAIAVVEGESGVLLGSVDTARASATVHEGAIYLHLGEAYRVLGFDGHTAVVERFSGDYYTQTQRDTTTEIAATSICRQVLGVDACFGRVVVSERVIGYQRRRIADGTAIETHPLDRPPETFETEAVWFSPHGHHLAHAGTEIALLGALHAAEHAMIAMLPLRAMCDRWDIGGLSTNLHPQTGAPTIFVYDGHPGGVGIAARGLERFEEWILDTARLLAGCRCQRGCPSCVQSPKCGNLNEPLDKGAALELLRNLLGPTSPDQPSSRSAEAIDCPPASAPAARSPWLATRCSTTSIVNARGSRSSVSSAQSSGVETGAPGCGRTE